MNEDEKMDLINKGIKIGLEHKKPAEGTLILINNLKNEMMDEIKNVKEAVEKRFDKFESKLDGLINTVSCFDDKFVKKEEYKEDMKIIHRVLEKLKAFRWQLIAIGSVILWVFDMLKDRIIK